MATKMFVNLPVHALKQSMEFFAKLGFTFNPHFTDDTAACMVVGEDSYVMLLTHAKFKIFTPKAICDATTSTEVLVALSAESRDKVDDMVRKAVAAGGTTYSEPQDHGFILTVSPIKNSLVYFISIIYIDHLAWRSYREEAKRGPPCGPHIPRNEGAMMSLLLLYATTGGVPHRLVVCDRGNPSGSVADAGHEAAARVRGPARASDDGVVDVPQAGMGRPVSR